MWYEMILGLSVLGALMVLSGLYRKGFDAMDRVERQADKKRWWWGLVVGVIALGAVSAAAEPTNYGVMCWQLLPFEDRLRAEIIQRDPAVAGFDLPAEWVGQIFPNPPTYILQGGGNGIESFNGTKFSIFIPLDNNTLSFFQGQPIGRLTVLMDADSMTGPWHADFVGGNGSTFVIRGTVREVDCDTPNPPVQSAQGFQSQTSPRLAGE